MVHNFGFCAFPRKKSDGFPEIYTGITLTTSSPLEREVHVPLRMHPLRHEGGQQPLLFPSAAQLCADLVQGMLHVVENELAGALLFRTFVFHANNFKSDPAGTLRGQV